MSLDYTIRMELQWNFGGIQVDNFQWNKGGHLGNVATLALGSWPRQGLANVCAKRKPGSYISCSPKCKRVWGNEPPHSQMNYHFGSWSPNFKNFGIPKLGVPIQNDIWVLAPWSGIEYKGEGGGFPRVRTVVSLVSLCLLMACPCTNNALVMH